MCTARLHDYPQTGIAQFGGTAPTAKPWKGLGPGVLEIVDSHDGNAYRAVIPNGMLSSSPNA